MKKLLVSILAALFCTVNALYAGKAPSGWETDFDSAKTKAVAGNLPVVVLFSGTDWCPPCKALRKNTLDKPDFLPALQGKCVLLYVDVPRGGDPKFERDMRDKYNFINLRGVPTAVVTDSNITKIIGRVNGRSTQAFVKAVESASAK